MHSSTSSSVAKSKNTSCPLRRVPCTYFLTSSFDGIPKPPAYAIVPFGICSNVLSFCLHFTYDSLSYDVRGGLMAPRPPLHHPHILIQFLPPPSYVTSIFSSLFMLQCEEYTHTISITTPDLIALRRDTEATARHSIPYIIIIISKLRRQAVKRERNAPPLGLSILTLQTDVPHL